ncbi:helix-turn-helix domain-containing protein [Photobacterium leiognathi]|uniref:helix-turn-helix domain-containing protein n=1 Tax=Photobacterium leiognathi TaxID=553611 RepID=UPI00298222DB|nr:helix-turn-helix domain-containing protein [Photobacterium leiognathi]
MSSRNNPNRIKSHSSYTVIDVSEALNVVTKTVRNWIKAGLPVADESRPLLIEGRDLKIFLKNKSKTNKHKCKVHEMYCFKCKQPKQPSIESLRFIAMPAGMIRMTGHCCECGYKANKYVSCRDLNSIWLELNGKLPIAEKHLILLGEALLNSPFNMVSDDE